MEKCEMKMPVFCSVREFASLGLISEYALRRMIREHRCPGFFSGVKFNVNRDYLIDLLTNAGTND